MSLLLTRAKERVLLTLKWAALQFKDVKQSPIASQQVMFLAAGIVIVLLLLIFSGGTAAVAAVAAWIALIRHFAQTDADRQRRISETYSRAVTQLASEKMEERLGGIYTLERISRESRDDYWTIMETLTAFLRERARGEDSDAAVESGEAATSIGGETRALKWRPPTDIAAVLAVIIRRPATQRNREKQENWFFNLRGADLRGTDLRDLCLDYGDLEGAHLEGADLRRAQLKDVHLQNAHLRDAYLRVACLEGADLTAARLEGARLQGANLRGALP